MGRHLQAVAALLLLAFVPSLVSANPTNLTNSPASDKTPSWSPDGETIAISSTKDGGREVFLYRPLDNSYTRVTFAPVSTSPTWSPTGNQLAFTSNRDGGWYIYVTSLDGTNPQRITNEGVNQYPSWSPTGEQIAYVSGRPDESDAIYLVNPDGSGQTRLTSIGRGSWYPTWSSDGKQIAFSGRRVQGGPVDILTISVADGKETNITNHPSKDLSPNWSPDGTRIAFVSQRDNLEGEVYIMDPDGGNVIRLTNNKTIEWFPTWSPDNTQIAFQVGPDQGTDIFVVRLDEPITQVRSQSWGLTKKGASVSSGLDD